MKRRSPMLIFIAILALVHGILGVFPEWKRKVIKGGSFLCAPNYTAAVIVRAARMAQPIDTSTCHLGFRCIVRGAKKD